ncbi:conserved hypothetical protein [Nitrosotalea sinensis]|uniref:Uncharacterized protein n=1 Tax=Nitrosotalea sinensis TaxID=1499975 RepID=A0A2H1EI63_9ARCH|nr:hypothetical protein [Candidatus Nitrosotalea sinensis]SHO47076.1 conserved hypothetical protein [Candidatus Nitrosotalea sinensis]
MSETEFPPFLKWGSYPSKDKENPDILVVEVLETETFETEFSTNIRANVDGIEMNIPLHNFESKNNQLLKKFLEAKKKGKIQVGKEFKIKTWKEQHPKKMTFEIRRYELVF